MPASLPRGRDLLRHVSIFSELDLSSLTELERLSQVKEFEGGAFIASEKEAGEALFVLARGRVKVVLYGESGREIILSVFKTPGDFFGEMSLVDDKPRSATLVAAEPSTLVVLSRDDFRAHIERFPRTALRVLTELSRRLRGADAIIGDLALLDVFGRLAGKLREFAEADGERTDEGFIVRNLPTQSEIAAMIGTSRETVSRALSELARRGQIVLVGRKLLVRRSFLL